MINFYLYICNSTTFFMEKIKTKDRLLLEAYKLFASKPYDQVTFTDLEKATKLSRGAILYHIQNKENLFQMVLEKYLIKRLTREFFLKDNPTISLKSFIKDSIAYYIKEVALEKSTGINNINLALINMLRDAIYIFPEMQSKLDEWCCSEANIWKQVVENAVQTKELKPDIDVEAISDMFYSIYLGKAYRGIARPYGVNFEEMKKEFRALYEIVKMG